VRTLPACLGPSFNGAEKRASALSVAYPLSGTKRTTREIEKCFEVAGGRYAKMHRRPQVTAVGEFVAAPDSALTQSRDLLPRKDSASPQEKGRFNERPFSLHDTPRSLALFRYRVNCFYDVSSFLADRRVERSAVGGAGSLPGWSRLVPGDARAPPRRCRRRSRRTRSARKCLHPSGPAGFSRRPLLHRWSSG